MSDLTLTKLITSCAIGVMLTGCSTADWGMIMDGVTQGLDQASQTQQRDAARRRAATACPYGQYRNTRGYCVSVNGTKTASSSAKKPSSSTRSGSSSRTTTSGSYSSDAYRAKQKQRRDERIRTQREKRAAEARADERQRTVESERREAERKARLAQQKRNEEARMAENEARELRIIAERKSRDEERARQRAEAEAELQREQMARNAAAAKREADLKREQLIEQRRKEYAASARKYCASIGKTWSGPRQASTNTKRRSDSPGAYVEGYRCK